MTEQTQEYVLRAMSKNYAPGNTWDHLDIEACAKAADEIKTLREANKTFADSAISRVYGGDAQSVKPHVKCDCGRKLENPCDCAKSGIHPALSPRLSDREDFYAKCSQEPLTWLAEHTNYELSYDGWDEDPAWQVHSVNGGRNDREWTLLATGTTPTEAIRGAMAVTSTASGSAAK